MHPLLRAAADRQLGLFTAIDARRAGHEPAEIRHLLASGTWVRVRRGVYAVADTLPATGAGIARHRVDCLAVLLALGRTSAVISHASAARLWAVPVPRDAQPTLRLTDPSGWYRGRDYVVTAAPLHGGEVFRSRPTPIRLTSAARTLVDCAREWALEDSVIALDAALLARSTSTELLQETLDRCRHWAGAPRARRAVALADGRAESPLETRGRLRMVGDGLPPDALQVEIRTGGRLIAVVDAWFEGPAVAVEFDGRVKYTNPWRDPGRVLWDEKRREDELRAHDVRVLRMADADLGAPWPTTSARLRRLLSTAGPVRRSFTAIPRDRGRLQRPSATS